MELELSVKIGIVMSGVYLWIGMLTGVWKYIQIATSKQARAHYYVDIAHRSSLLYAPATLILAVLAYFSVYSESINLACMLLNVVFFSFSIASYVLHGLLQDTTNQFKQPHQMGKWTLPSILMRLAMYGLILTEVLGTGILLFGTIKAIF